MTEEMLMMQSEVEMDMIGQEVVYDVRSVRDVLMKEEEVVTVAEIETETVAETETETETVVEVEPRVEVEVEVVEERSSE
jgi:hypothetical protein